jgi:hypothetical protein
MKKYLLIIFCSLLTTLYAQAQDSTKTKIYRNHIGINTQFAQDQFFNPSARTPLQMMYKRQNKKNNGAWRVSLGVYYKTEDSLWISFYNPYSKAINSNLKGSFALGYEWQKNIKQKLWLYYGADLQIIYQSKKLQFEDIRAVTSNTSYTSLLDEQYWLITSLKPLVGLRFHLSKQCYLAMESSLQLYFENNQRIITIKNKNNGVEFMAGHEDISTTNYEVSFQAYSGIYLFYQF